MLVQKKKKKKKTLVHDKPNMRGTFSEYSSKGYVLGTAFENYCSWTMWMKDTTATRIERYPRQHVEGRHLWGSIGGLTPRK